MTTVAVYNASERLTGYTTGTGKHVKHMVAGLTADPRFDVEFLVPANCWERDQRCSPASPLYATRSRRLPIGRLALDAVNIASSMLHAERMAGRIDWVYCPREQFVRTKRAYSAVTIHDVFKYEPDQLPGLTARERVRMALWRKAALAADLVLTVSEFSKDRIAQVFGVEAARIRVVGNGVEQAFFDAANRKPPSEKSPVDAPYFLSVGGLTKKKGAEAQLRFAEILTRLHPSSQLVVVGPVEPEYEMAARASKGLKIIDRGLSDDAIISLLTGAIASVSLSEYEGFGIPVLEAMAASVPVIASKRAALPEVVGDAGLLVEPTSVAGLEEAVALYENESLRAELARKGRLRASQFTWDACVQKLKAALV
jgi:glycosyltransferase involved in cell wall biosynthesis